MPQYQLDIFKHLGTETWANVWHFNYTSTPPSTQWVLDFCNRESGMHYSNVTYDRAVLRPMPITSNVYTEFPLSYQGGRSGNTDLPLFVVARCTLLANLGRPGIKMFRGALSEADIENVGNTTTAARTFFESQWDALFNEFPELCKPDGTLLYDGVLNGRVGMRQLTQRSPKPPTP